MDKKKQHKRFPIYKCKLEKSIPLLDKEQTQTQKKQQNTMCFIDLNVLCSKEQLTYMGHAETLKLLMNLKKRKIKKAQLTILKPAQKSPDLSHLMSEGDVDDRERRKHFGTT